MVEDPVCAKSVDRDATGPVPCCSGEQRPSMPAVAPGVDDERRARWIALAAYAVCLVAIAWGLLRGEQLALFAGVVGLAVLLLITRA